MKPHRATRLAAVIPALASLAVMPSIAASSTYVVYLPLDSSVYTELETLNGLGYLDTYLDEIRPVSRVEAARLTLEAARNLEDSGENDQLARDLIGTLRDQLRQETGWLKNGSEDDQPTMVHPLERIEMQYVFSSGPRRHWRTSATGTPDDSGINAAEATPLLPDNDGLPTSPGSNQIARLSSWAGVGGFLTAYGEGAVAGPFTRTVSGPEGTDASRLNLVRGEAVVSLGNLALSFGREEMAWGSGFFAELAQSANAPAFVAARLQNIHPLILPLMFRYLGQCRFQIFFGQLDDDRYFTRPWIDGEIFSFKPLPTFEFGLTHTIDFGGQHNDNYGVGGFLGRATGFATGSPVGANTNSRAGVYLKFYFPSLRNLQVYQEILGEDNLTAEARPLGRFLPFLAVSYQGGFYLPRLTRDGLTSLRFEYALLEPNYSVHNDSLYWTYQGQLMGDPLGPNASEVDLEIERWLDSREMLSVGAFYTEQAPSYGSHVQYPSQFYPYSPDNEHGAGVWFNFLRLSRPLAGRNGTLATVRARAALEYAQDLNYQSHANSVRFLLMLSGAFRPGLPGFVWN